MREIKGRITTIQRMSIHDGPGIRTTIFMKGCNMRCKWCHNPETWRNGSQLEFVKDNCIKCWQCIDVCPQDALSNENNLLNIDRDKCNGCGVCQPACYSNALVIVGEEISVSDAMGKILQDKTYYKVSDGGVTISGGEPLLQSAFVKALVEACRKEGIHTCVESNFAVNWKTIEEVLPFVDLWRVDLKMTDDQAHKEWTGIPNKQILQNLDRLSKYKIPVIISTPVIPGVNDNEKEIKNICGYIKKWKNVEEFNLLPFHSLGFSKFESLGMENPLPLDISLDNDHFKKLKLIQADCGF